MLQQVRHKSINRNINKLIRHLIIFIMKIGAEALSKKINGLFYFKNFISNQQKNTILNIINSKPWCLKLRRKQQYYGIKYFQTKYLDKDLQNKQSLEQQHHQNLQLFNFLVKKMTSAKVFQPQDPPNQCLVNKYLKRDYLGMHVEDKNCYGPIIAGLSLGSTDYLRLNQDFDSDSAASKINQGKDQNNFYMEMQDRSLYVLKGEARQNYRHGIGRSFQGVSYKDYNFQRISLTFRHVIDSRRKL